MAKGPYITDFERDVIRIGIAAGIKAPKIALFLGRNKMGIYNQIKKMESDGTLQNVPLAFVCDEIAAAIRAKGATNE